MSSQKSRREANTHLKGSVWSTSRIPEYWIADYAGLGETRHIGKPKQPTLSICTLVKGEYEIQQIRGNQSITSPTFPNFKLTAEQVLKAGR